MKKIDLLKNEVNGLAKELAHPEGKRLPNYGNYTFLQAVWTVRKRELIAEKLRFNHLKK